MCNAERNTGFLLKNLLSAVGLAVFGRALPALHTVVYSSWDMTCSAAWPFVARARPAPQVTSFGTWSNTWA